uniref:Enhancer of polycomb-like protein n=1 Tax=Wollemia nobilis TaxID=56998 RepID=A0A0C9S9Y1_9CONI
MRARTLRNVRTMSRLSFRPRPIDVTKKIPIVRSVKDLEDDENAGTRSSQIARLQLENENDVVHASAVRKIATEIPTPQFVVVESYERDYARTFVQPSSYLRGRGNRENSENIEYDLDDEDEDWLQEFNDEKKILEFDKFEIMLHKLEIMDHKTRERAVGSGATFGQTVPVVLPLDAAVEALQSPNSRYAVLQAVYNYWKAKRDRWQKPILRRLQPPPPVNDTNPYNVFRPREKAHRLHTRRMQRRENNVQSFEKLRQVRRNIEQAKGVLRFICKREEQKRECVENEINYQRLQIKYKHDIQHEDGFTILGLPPPYNKSTFPKRGDDEHAAGQLANSSDLANGHVRVRPGFTQTPPVTDAMPMMEVSDQNKREWKRNQEQHRGRMNRRDPQEPVLLFTKPIDPERLAAAGIVPPPDPPIQNGATVPPYHWRPRMGRGGRIVFDRWNCLTQTPLGCDR